MRLRSSPRQLVLGAACVLIVVIVAVSIGSALFLRERETEEWRRQLDNLSLLLAAQTDQTMSSSRLAMDSIAEHIDAIGIGNEAELRAKAGTPEMHQMMRDKITGLPHVDVATIVAANGDVINFTRSFPAPPINLSDRDYFQIRRDNPNLGFFVSLPVQNKGNGKWVFYLSRRLNDAKGRFMGLILVGISVDQFTNFYESLAKNLGEGAAITLYRRDFSVLTRWPRQDDSIGKKNLTGTSYTVVEKMNKAHEVIYTEGPRFSEAGVSIARLGAVRVLDRFPMVVNLTVTEDLFLATWRHMTKLIVAGATGGILVVLVATLLLMRITRKKEQSDELLRLNELRYRSIIEASPVPYSLNDEQQNITYLNAAFIRTFGYSNEDIPTLREWLPKAYPDDSYRQWVSTTWQEHLNGAREQSAPFEPMEISICCKDGSMRTVLAAAAPLEASLAGTHLVSLYDITDRKTAEEQVRKLAQAVEQSPEGITVANLDGDIEYANAAFSRNTGYSREEVLGKNSRFLQSGQTPRETYLSLWDALTKGNVWKGEFTNKRKDGSTYNEMTVISPIREPSGKVTHYVAVKEDITERKRVQQQLERLLTEQKAMLENDLVGIVKVKSRTIVWANPAFETMLGYASGELISQPTRKNYPSEEAYLAFGSAAYTVLNEGKVFRSQIEHVRKDGRTIWVDVSGSLLDIENQESLWGFIDITDRKQFEQKLAENEERMELALAGADLGLWDLNIPSGTFTHNVRLVTMIGYVPNEVDVSVKMFLSLLHPEDLETLSADFYAHLKMETPEFQSEYRLRHKQGHWVWLLSRGKVVNRDKDGRAIRMTGTSLDITERKANEEKISDLAFYDPLTRLPNRRLLLDRLGLALPTSARRGMYGAILFLDLDNFKVLNDTKGHEFGDLLLIDVARRLLSCVRTEDTVARQGGDEFVVMLEDLNPDAQLAAAHAEGVAEKVRTTLAETYLLHDYQHHCTSSIGICMFKGTDKTLDEILRDADMAMYKAKAAGKNLIYLFQPN